MPAIPKPIRRTYDLRRRTSRLFFDDHEPPVMETWLKGGIFFPSPWLRNGQVDISGFAVLTGLDLDTGVVWVFEQAEFVTVDDIVDQDIGAIKYEGISHWFNRLWNEYFASTWYFYQVDELSRRARLQVLRSDMIRPKPVFSELPPVGFDDLTAAIWLRVKRGELRFPRDSEVDRQLRQVMAGDKDLMPAVHALGCAMVGHERYRWRKPRPERVIEEFIPSGF